MRAVFSSLCRRARRELGITKPRCAEATFLQRFGDALNLNIHLHSDVLDQRGLGPDDDPCGADPLTEEGSWLAALAAASVQGRIAIRAQGTSPTDVPPR